MKNDNFPKTAMFMVTLFIKNIHCNKQNVGFLYIAPSIVIFVKLLVALKFKHFLRVFKINMRNIFLLIYEANSIQNSNFNLRIAAICRLRFAEFIT